MPRRPRQPAPGAAVARLPPRPGLSHLLPSARSIAVGVAVALLAVLAYVVARETSLFAVRTVDVQGVPAPVAARVERALRPLEGRSLLDVDGGDVAALVTPLPYVAGVTYDRAFPNTLRVRVEPERPVAVVRRGAEAWLVSRRGRVMKRIPQGTHRKLPRVWLPKSVPVSLGATMAAGAGGDEVAMLVPLHGAHLARRVAQVHRVEGEYVYRLRSGAELRIGDASNLALKLAIASRILATTSVHGYLDVSVPERPVATAEPQPSS